MADNIVSNKSGCTLSFFLGVWVSFGQGFVGTERKKEREKRTGYRTEDIRIWAVFFLFLHILNNFFFLGLFANGQVSRFGGE